MIAELVRPVTLPALAPAWRRPLAMLGLAAAAILLLLARDAADMGAIWWTSSTFQHVLLIPPILGWLVWQRRAELARLEPVAWPPGLLISALGGLGWLLGDAAGVALARHAGLVLLLQGAAVACLGPVVARAIAFPLAYALFLIPFGEELVPALQTLTAKMCMALLALAGVPAHLDGVFITIPNGYFEVAEACSGVKFLIAMLAFGVLAANQCFLDWRRRIGFVALAVIVPVLANGLRAWGTIYVAHLTSVDVATGFDHIVYGWVFFAIVVALVLAIGWPFFDRDPAAPMIDVERLPAGPRARAIGPVAVAAVLLALLPAGWSAIVAARAEPLPAIAAPAVPGWSLTPASPRVPWRPRYDGADRMLAVRYADRAGRSVDLVIAAYARQGEGRELVGYGQGPIDPAGDWAWSADIAAPVGGRALRIVAPGPVEREVALFHRIGGLMAGSAIEVKLRTLTARLTGGDQRAAAILVSAEGEGGRSAIDAFLVAAGGPARLADRAIGR